MKNLRGKFERFCYRNQKKGIPNLMLWVIGLNVITYIFSMIDPSNTLYWLLCFDRNAILHGQVWRLVTFITLSLQSYSYLWVIIAVIFYIQLGKALENTWGRFRFNLYYLTGILFLDLAGFLLNVPVSADSLNTSLFLAFATLYPETTFLVFFIIPIKARWLGILNLLIFLLQLLSFSVFPFNLLPLFALANYFLYLGKDFLNIFPISWQVNANRVKKKMSSGKRGKQVPFPGAGSYTASTARPEAPYTHKCTVCGRTDVTNPELEFRYCSKCKGYYCYCEDHINNHTHPGSCSHGKPASFP